MTTATQPLVGDALLAHIERFPDASKTELCLTAGYVNSQGKPAYVAFYTELLNARPIVTDHNKDAANDAEYDDLSNDDKDLYDAITELLGEKWTHEETIEFMDELEDIGIETASEFTDAYEYDTDEHWAEKAFAESFCVDVLDARIPDIVLSSIDWQDVWDHELRYEYNTIETNNGTFFFRNN